MIRFNKIVFIFFILYSCNTSKVENLDKLFHQIESNELLVDSLLDFNSDSTLINNYFFAKQISKSRPKEALGIISQIKHFLSGEYENTSFYQKVLSFEFEHDYLLNDNSIYSLDSLISTLPKNKNHTLHLIDLLSKKSMVLGYEDSEYDYAYATSLYAEYLRSSLPEDVRDDSFFLPWSVLGTLYDRNSLSNYARFYYEKSLSRGDNRSQREKLIEYYLETLDKEIDDVYYEKLISRFIDSTDLNTEYNKIIQTDIVMKSSDERVISIAKSKLAHTDNICEFYSFLEMTYLVDAYLNLSDFVNARNLLDKISACNEEGLLLFLKEYRELKYFSLMAKVNNDSSFDLKILKKSHELLSLYSEFGNHILNEHYAEVVYNCNVITMQALFRLMQSHSGIDVNSSMAELNSFKYLYDKINDSSSLLNGKVINDSLLSSFIDKRIKLENLELDVNNYLSTSFLNLEIFEEIYNLHKDIYYLKSQFLEYENYTGYEEDLHIKFENIPNAIQIIDIFLTDSHYYLTNLTRDSFFIQRYEAEFIENSASEYLENIVSKNNDLDFSNVEFMKIICENIDTTKTSLHIIPDGIFCGVPFEPLIENFGAPKVISYASRINKLQLNKSKILKHSINIYSYSDKKSLENKSKKNFPELKYGLEEAESIRDKYNKSKTYFGDSFNFDVLNITGSNEIHHFSTHSSSDRSNYLKNFIVTRTAEGKENKIFGFNLKRFDFNNNLIVLSSCNSGMGTSKPGTGVFSLSRDFLQAGAQTVIKSLWAVNEASTKDLMIAFHTFFTEGQSAGEALTNAKIKVKQNPKYAHPYYWAGFVLEGNPNVYLEREGQ